VRWSLEHGADYLLTIKATNQPCANRSKSWLPPSMRIFPPHEPTPTKARRSAAGKEKDLRCGIRCDNALTIPPLPLGIGLLEASRAITPQKALDKSQNAQVRLSVAPLPLHPPYMFRMLSFRSTLTQRPI
jgi:hypothetical protein